MVLIKASYEYKASDLLWNILSIEPDLCLFAFFVQFRDYYWFWPIKFESTAVLLYCVTSMEGLAVENLSRYKSELSTSADNYLDLKFFKFVTFRVDFRYKY